MSILAEKRPAVLFIAEEGIVFFDTIGAKAMGYYCTAASGNISDPPGIIRNPLSLAYAAYRNKSKFPDTFAGE